jgi:hypothetical protein
MDAAMEGGRLSELQILCIEPVQSNQALKNVVWPWIKNQTMAGNRISLECRYAEDAKTDQQRRYYHGVILQQIAQQAAVNGQKFPLAVWKEHFRNEYLGFRTVTYTNPMTGKKSRRRVRKSTEDLGVKGYNVLIEKVTAFGATELGVVFDRSQENVDPDTGEIYQ